MPAYIKYVTIGLVVVLFIIVYFGGSAPLHKRSTDCQCFLPCDGALQPKDKRVHVLIEHQSETVLDKIFTASSLFKDHRCAVPLQDCSSEDSLYTMKVYDDQLPVPNLVYENPHLKPVSKECPEEHGRIKSGAERTSSSKLLILLLICIYVSILGFY